MYHFVIEDRRLVFEIIQIALFCKNCNFFKQEPKVQPRVEGCILVGEGYMSVKYKSRRVDEGNRKRNLLKIPTDLEILVSILVMWNLKFSLVSKFYTEVFRGNGRFYQ